jgi:alanyl aminopeptidase
LAERALALTLSPDFDARETVRLLFAVDYPELAALPFDFVRQHFDALVARLPRGVGSDAGAMLPETANGMCSLEARDQVKAIFQPGVGMFTGAPRVLAQVLEEIQVCAAVKEKQGPDVAQFLQR